MDDRLSPTVISTIVMRAARSPHGTRSEAIRDVAALRNVFSTNGLIALFDAPWVVVYVLVIWAFHPALGMGAAVSAVVMLTLAWLNDRISRRALEGLQKEGRRATQYVESSLRNAEVLQALGMTDRLLERWQTLQQRVALLQTSASRSSVAFTSLTRFVRHAIQIFMLALGAYLVLTDHATAGVMIATTVLLGRAVQPVEQLVGSWRMLTDARAAYRRLRELSEDFDDQPPRLRMPRPEGRLVVDNVSFRAPVSEKPILFNVAYWPRPDLGPWIGYVPQDVELFDGTVAENIARLGTVEPEAVVAAAKLANTHELVLSLPNGYDTQVGEQGSRLSPGQRQRIALARALYGGPRFVVLDEPNSNLDGAGEIALADALRRLRKDGVTSVVVTHRPSLIAHVDKILVLENGRVQQFGPASEVMKPAAPSRSENMKPPMPSRVQLS